MTQMLPFAEVWLSAQVSSSLPPSPVCDQAFISRWSYTTQGNSFYLHWGNWGHQRLRNLSKAMELPKGKMRFQSNPSGAHRFCCSCSGVWSPFSGDQGLQFGPFLMVSYPVIPFSMGEFPLGPQPMEISLWHLGCDFKGAHIFKF